MGGVKVCNKCRRELPADAYQRKASTPDGLARTCRTCDNARRIQRKIEKGLRRPDPAPGHKWCEKCKAEKPLSAFYVRKSGPQQGKPHAYCVECTKADNIARARRRGVPARREADPLYLRRRTLARFGLTVEDYDRMLEDQGGVCRGCGVAPNGRSLCVDHDHGCCPGEESCGECVRGLLCHHCNFAIGHAQDSSAVLRNLATYLDAYGFSNPS